jgi:hypothetical protein
LSEVRSLGAVEDGLLLWGQFHSVQ